ncbi:MAG: twin transmembrane helix small protein [Alphaproteobacteria bacterium]|nr:twin transmembrane helix small protein [Alphaproteobacteria bacterium]
MSWAIVIMIALSVVVAILGAGLFAMARGGTFDKKYSNRLMQLRVVAQGVALLLILLALLFSGHGG